MNLFDVIVIGGGMAGAAITYHLARLGAKTLLLEKNELGSGSTAGCAGRVQVSEAQPGLNLQLVQLGLGRWAELEAELELDLGWGRHGNLLLIDTEGQWADWSERCNWFSRLGLQVELVNRADLSRLEPGLDSTGYLGAVYDQEEGHCDPFKFVFGYARQARRYGAVIRQHSAAVGFETTGQRLTGVKTAAETFGAAQVVLAAGAWSPQFGQLLGVDIPLQHSHAEAIITERVAPLVRHHIGLADFYETIHNSPQAVSVGFRQLPNGSILITEAVDAHVHFQRRNTAWGPAGIAADLLKLFPALARVRVVRSWARPTPFAADEQPLIGPLPAWDNLYAALYFHLSLTTLPVVSALIAAEVLGQPVEPALTPFAPARFYQNQKSAEFAGFGR
jgi:glycine/D-amino acid oxidase-like deaminating enzyme